MAANEYIRTVNITPLGTSYSWDTPPNWITIVRVGTTDDWTITVSPNSGVARNATLTVRHANTSTIDTIEVTQAGNTVITPTATPAPTAAPTASPAPTAVPTATPVSTPIPTVAATPVSTPIPTVAATPVSTPVPEPTLAATPVSTPVPVRSIDINDNGNVLTMINLNDYANGPGQSVVTKSFSYSNNGTTTNQVPTIISKDPKYSVELVYGTNIFGNVVGSVIITSLDAGAKFPVSQMLSPLVIAHPNDNSVRHTLAITLIQGQREVTPIPTLAATPVATPAATVVATPLPTFQPITPTATTSTGGGGGGGGGCHIAGEMITLANGETKAIENIQLGDILLSYNVDGYDGSEDAYRSWTSHVDNLEGEFTSVEVTNIIVDTYSSYYNFNEGSLKITHEHPILIKDINNIVSWKKASDANLGEFMLNEDSQWVLINTKSLVNTAQPFSTWSIDVESEDVYFANGILVHNAAIDFVIDDKNVEIQQ